jgi:hypothetical protein
MGMGPPRFELELLPPQGRRMPSYPTGPRVRNAIKMYIIRFAVFHFIILIIIKLSTIKFYIRIKYLQ